MSITADSAPTVLLSCFCCLPCRKHQTVLWCVVLAWYLVYMFHTYLFLWRHIHSAVCVLGSRVVQLDMACGLVRLLVLLRHCLVQLQLYASGKHATDTLHTQYYTCTTHVLHKCYTRTTHVLHVLHAYYTRTTHTTCILHMYYTYYISATHVLHMYYTRTT